MLSIEGLSAGYGRLTVVRNVNLVVEPGQATCLIGNNGAGKTTVLRAIFGMLDHRSGSIRFENRDLLRSRADSLVDAGLALVPEGRRIFKNLTVRENLLVGIAARRGRARQTLEVERVVDLLPELVPKLGVRAGVLSGGEQQMVAIGRALCARPRLLVLDEPSLGLAPLVVQRIYDILADLRSDALSILLVEQDVDRALSLADRGYLMDAGEVVASGSSDELRSSPDIRARYLGTKVTGPRAHLSGSRARAGTGRVS